MSVKNMHGKIDSDEAVHFLMILINITHVLEQINAKVCTSPPAWS